MIPVTEKVTALLKALGPDWEFAPCKFFEGHEGYVFSFCTNAEWRENRRSRSPKFIDVFEKNAAQAVVEKEA